MLVDSQNVEDLVALFSEIERLTGVILDSLEKRKALKRRLGEVFTELKQKQLRLPYDEAEATERAPAKSSNGNGHRGRRKAGTDGARA